MRESSSWNQVSSPSDDRKGRLTFSSNARLRRQCSRPDRLKDAGTLANWVSAIWKWSARRSRLQHLQLLFGTVICWSIANCILRVDNESYTCLVYACSNKAYD